MNVFITGMMRSGTTLINDIINAFPRYSSDNQLQTTLFLETKKKFLAEKKLDASLPLSNYFLEKYSVKHFTDFLKNNFSLTHFFDDKDLTGLKEILCEEYLPYFLEKEIKCILIIRDPRSVIASMHYGSGEIFVGKHRPILFDIRNWRKSAAFALQYQTHPHLKIIKYEDLVNDANKIIKDVASFLHVIVDPEKIIKEIQTDNSSFSAGKGIYKNQLSKYSEILTEEITRFIEWSCYPELRSLGYETQKRQMISSFKDPFENSRSEFLNFNYAKELEVEIERLNKLERNDKTDVESFFIFPEVFEKLRNSCLEA